MSLQWALSRTVPADTAAIGQTILAEDNLYRQIGDHFDELFPQEGVFEPLYEPEGRGAISPLLVSLVTIFQMQEKVPDRTAAAWVVSRIDWKYALHLPLGYPGFHFTDLYAFRMRLLEHHQERLVFDQTLLKLKELGVLKVRGKMRTDSTHLLGVVERLSQFELVAESIRMALKAVSEQFSAWVEQQIPASFRDSYGRRQSTFGLSETQVKQLLIQAGQDGFWFLHQLDQTAPEEARTRAEVVLLRQVLEQQFPQGPHQPPADKRPAGKEIIESPHEPEVRMGTKRGKNWLGYKAQLTETCDADLPHLIVDLEPTHAVENDARQLPSIQQRLKKNELLPAEQYVDQGYMSTAHLIQSEQLGIDLLGPMPEDTRPDNGFRQSNFQLDLHTQQAICPVGQKNHLWSASAATAKRPARIKVRFWGSTCQACPFFGKCTRSPHGRSLEIVPQRERLEAYRQIAHTEEFKKKLHLRAGVEGSFSELVRRYHFRFARYRGLVRLQLQLYFTAIAVDLARLGRWWNRPLELEEAAA